MFSFSQKFYNYCVLKNNLFSVFPNKFPPSEKKILDNSLFRALAPVPVLPCRLAALSFPRISCIPACELIVQRDPYAGLWPDNVSRARRPAERSAELSRPVEVARPPLPQPLSPGA